MSKTLLPEKNMTVRRTLIAGNWKLNGTRDSSVTLATVVAAEASNAIDVVVCPPFPFLDAVAQATSGSAVAVGAQNVASEASGAYTGEVAADMLRAVGVTYAIVGHSERRTLFGESDADVGARTRGALAAGVCPIVCVGETREEREADAVEEVIGRQLSAVADSIGASAFADCVIAYEPVWAIGTGLTASPEQAQAVHAFIREWLVNAGAEAADSVRILYGGSMKPGNAAELLGQPDIDGGLVGGASLVAEDFLGICRAAS